MEEATDERGNGAQGGMATATVADGFAAHPILLSCEREGHEGGGQQICIRGMEQIETSMADPHPAVLDAKEIVNGGVGDATVFAGAQKEEIRKEKAVACGRQTCGGGGRKGLGVGFAENHEREGFHASRRGICFLPGSVERLKAKIEIAERVQARVRGPHPGERLRHMAEGVYHSARADGLVAGRDGTGTVPLSE